MRVAVPEPIVHLDPRQTESLATRALVLPSYNSLLRIQPGTLELLPELAESWELLDPATYLLRLRRGVAFHNGQELTSEDVRWSLEALRNPPQGMASVLADSLAGIQSIEALDRYTVRISYRRAPASLPRALAQGATIVTPKAVDAQGPGMKGRVVGTGPFMFTEFQPQIGGRATRNPNYFLQGKPYLEGWQVQVIPDVYVALAAFLTGQVDLLQHPLPQDWALRVQREVPGAQVFEQKPTGGPSFWLNTRWGPFQDERVRRAIHLAVNRQGFLRLEGGPTVRVDRPLLNTPWELPDSELFQIPGYRPDKGPDLEEARRLLTEARYPFGFEFEVWVWRSIGPGIGAGSQGECEFVRQQLLPLDVYANCNPNRLDPLSALQAQEPEYQALSMKTSVSWDDPDVLIPFFHARGTRNYAHLNNSIVNALLERQSEALDPRQRQQVVWDASRALLDAASGFWLYRQSNFYVLQPWVQGFDASYAYAFSDMARHDLTRLELARLPQGRR